jgi:hypothetical protein
MLHLELGVNEKGEKMIGRIIETPAGAYVSCALQDGAISNEQDFLDLLTCCGDIERNLILLGQEHLHPDFFDLSTGLAGAILGKCAIYHVKTAIVINLDGIQSERFHEMAGESNKGNQVRFFEDLNPAEEWLLA